MIVRIARIAALTLLSPVLAPAVATAQDVPGIEICTVEKTMERRTSCLQSNVDFLQKTIGKLAIDHQQKIDAANRQIEGLKAVVAALQKTVDDLQAAQKKTAEAQKKAESPPAKDVPAAVQLRTAAAASKRSPCVKRLCRFFIVQTGSANDMPFSFDFRNLMAMNDLRGGDSFRGRSFTSKTHRRSHPYRAKRLPRPT